MNLKLIVRLTTERYLHNNCLVEKRKLSLLKRKSEGVMSDLIQDAEFDLINLDIGKYDDGVYELRIANESIDIESGYIDDYDLVLVDFE